MTVTSNIFSALPVWVSGQSYPSTQGIARASTGTYFDASGVLQLAAINELRVDHDRTSPFASRGNLLESASTNIVRNPRMLGTTTGTIGSGGAVGTFQYSPGNTAGVDTAIVGTGTDQGIPYLDVRFVGTSTAAATVFFHFESGATASPAIAQGQIWTQGGYVKLQAGSLTNVTTTLVVVETNSATGYLSEHDLGFTPTTSALASQFISQTATLASASVDTLQYTLYVDFQTGVAVDVTIRLGGPQLELKSSATSLMLPAVGATGATSRATDLSLIPRRVSNVGNAYQLTVPGTSSTGPSGTGSNITDGSCTWKYLGSVDYTSLAAWASTIPATLTQPLIGQIWNCGPLFPTAATALLTLSGHTTSATNTITVKAAPGDSIRDSLATQSVALQYNVNQGVCVSLPNAVGNVNYFQISDANVVIDGIQFQDPNSTSNCTIIGGPGAAPVIRNCIVDGYGQINGASIIGMEAGGTVYNCLFVDRQAAGATGECIRLDGNSALINCTIINPNNNTGGVALNTLNSPTAVRTRNCAFFGYSNPFGTATTTNTVDHCCFSAASFSNSINGSSNLFAKTAANQFVSATTDLRLKTGADCFNAAVTDSADIPSTDDIAGTLRPQGTAWDIGAWELVASRTATATVPFFLLNARGQLTVAAVSLAPLQILTDPAITGFSTSAQTVSSVTLTWAYQPSVNLTVDPSSPAVNLLADNGGIFSFTGTENINFAVKASAAQFNRTTTAVGSIQLRAIGAFAKPVITATAVNSITFSTNGVFTSGTVYASTPLSGVTNTTTTGTSNTSISLSWAAPSSVETPFFQIRSNSALVKGVVAQSNLLFVMAMSAIGTTKEFTNASGSASFAVVSAKASAQNLTYATLPPVTIEALTATGVAAAPDAAAGQATFFAITITQTLYFVSGRANIDFQVIARASPVPVATTKNNINYFSSGTATKSTNASESANINFGVVGNAASFEFASALAEFFDIRASIISSLAAAGSSKLEVLSALGNLVQAETANALATIPTISIAQFLTQFLLTEDGHNLAAESRLQLRADLLIPALIQEDLTTTAASLLALSAAGSAKLVPFFISVMASANVDWQSIGNLMVPFGASGFANIDFKLVGGLGPASSGAATMMQLSMFQPQPSQLLADPFGIPLFWDPVAPAIAAYADVSGLNIIQEDLAAESAVIMPISAVVTGIVGNNAAAVDNLDVAARGQIEQFTTGVGLASFSAVQAIGNAFIVGQFASNDLAIDYTVAASVSQSDPATASSNIDLAATSVLLQGNLFSGSGTLAFSATANAINAQDVVAISSLLPLTASGFAVINGHELTGMAAIVFAVEAATTGITFGTASATFQIIENASGKLWATPAGFVEGETVVYWPD